MSDSQSAPDYLASIRADAARIADLLTSRDGVLAVGVPSCSQWSVRQLVTHLGGVHRMVTTAVTTRGPSHSTHHAPDRHLSAPDLAAWLRAGAQDMCQALSTDPQAPAWSFDPQGGTVGWWRRRQAMETLIHRVDMEQTVDAPGHIDAELAADGIGEVLDVMVRLRRQEGALTLPGEAVLLRAEPEGREWTLGSGLLRGRAVGSAADLLLVLWRRLPISALTTDTAAVRTLNLPLVP